MIRARTSVALIGMPWHMLGSPSIQLGTLEAILRAADVPCRSHSFFLAFAEFLTQSGDFDLDDYGEVSGRWENLGLGEWLFATPAIRRASGARDERYLALLAAAGVPRGLVRKLRRLRDRIPAFLERCADELAASEPGVVGFTNVYSQTCPSMALARVLKKRDPDLRIVMGGASCEGPMGPALLKASADLDVIVRGPADGLVVELMRALLTRAPAPRYAGLCLRVDDRIVEIEDGEATAVDLDALPVPVFDEYFERLCGSSLADTILPQIPFESSRGCWWGMKSHCTFCGLNGQSMAFRSKSPERVLREVDAQATRYGRLDFTSVDNIMDWNYFGELLPHLAARPHDFGFFFETKSNLKEAQVVQLRAAGIRTIQPGIESLSTPVLREMKKGVTAFQNVRLLKWCAVHGIRVIWNLLYGFPHEDPAEYERMAEQVRSLVHLPPPSLSRLALYRFSPYHNDPAGHGLVQEGPLPYYELVYDLEGDDLLDLAQSFRFAYADGRDPETYTRALREQVERWNRDSRRNRGALTFRQGPGFLVITDTRTTTTRSALRYMLEGDEARVYAACAAGATTKALARELAAGDSGLDLEAFLADLRAARLVYEEAGRVLALALPNEIHDGDL